MTGRFQTPVLQDNGIQINKTIRWQMCQIDFSYMCIRWLWDEIYISKTYPI